MTDGERLAGFAEASEGRMHHRQHRRIGHGAQRTGRRSQSLGTNRIIQIRFKNNNARFSKKKIQTSIVWWSILFLVPDMN